MKQKVVYLFRAYLTHYFVLILTGATLNSTTTVLAEESSLVAKNIKPDTSLNSLLNKNIKFKSKFLLDTDNQKQNICQENQHNYKKIDTTTKYFLNKADNYDVTFNKLPINNIFTINNSIFIASNLHQKTIFTNQQTTTINIVSKELDKKNNYFAQKISNLKKDNIGLQKFNNNYYYYSKHTINNKYIFAQLINQNKCIISQEDTYIKNNNLPVAQSRENNEINSKSLSYPATILGNPPQGPFRSLTDNIFPTTQPHLGDDLSFTDYYQWKRKISAQNGFDFVIATAPIFQVGSNNAQVYFDNELDILAQWRLFENKQTEGKFFSWIQYVQTFSRPTGEFAASQNLITLPNGGATDPKQYVIAVSALWWEQSLLNGNLSYRIGQLYAPSLWGTNKYLGDDRITFMNSVLGNPQGANWPSRGIGANVTLGNDSVYTAVGFQDATANQNGLDFTSFGDGRFFYLGEVGYTPKINDKYEGAYRATVSYIDRTSNKSGEENRPGWSMILSAQQDFSDHFGVFAIYRQSWERFTNGVFSTAGAGVVFNQPFDWDDDQVGIGYFYANPTNPDFRDEHGLEMYYKLQLTHRLEFTPDMQIIFTPARNDGMVVIPGLRLRYVL